MIQRHVSASLEQYDTIADLSVRDTATMASGVILLCSLCWFVGYPLVAFGIAAAILIFETTLRLMFKRKWVFAGMSRVQILITALMIHFANVIAFATPALVLASDPSFALKVTGLFSIVGMQVYIANTWSRVPVFLCAMLGPAIVMLGLTFLQLERTMPSPSPMTHWGFATGFLFLFIFITIDTLRQQIAIEAKLLSAQRDAASRLAQLEESHRLDALTGLLNRPAFDLALHVMLDDRAQNGGEITVFLIDLDSFKPINDTYSHEAGDEVLTQSARRLRAVVGQGGIVGRLGGDEFICAVHDMSGGDDVLTFGERLYAAIAQPIDWSDRTLKVVASIGAAVTGAKTSQPGATVSALCAAADQAMFASKSAPNQKTVIYEAHLFAPRMTAEDKQALVDGISSRALKPYYQPKIHLPSGKIIGFEALARWDHPTKGLRPPAKFISEINEMGLQGDFMVSMAQQVVGDIQSMLRAGLDPGQVSLNVPEVALATHTGRQDLQTIVADNPDAARHLTFEITEDVFIARAADTIQASIAGFRALGVRISLDDFGTGFASFHHLRQLDFDELKIDTSFVAGLGADPISEVLVRGFLDIASGLGVSIIAEGVETEAQSRDLINMGCMTAQGFLFSPAVPLAAAMEKLADQAAA